MKNIYFTVTGLRYRFETEFFEPGMEVMLEKEPDNEYDKEAIKVSMEGLGQIGYVANSTRTVLGESYSAGRLYDRIGDSARSVAKYKLENGVICTVCSEDVLFEPAPVIEQKAE